MPDILEKIFQVKRREVAGLAPRLADFRAACRDAPPPRSMAEALRRASDEPVRIIAEVKHKSPSAGVIADPFDPVAIARAYEEAGADAISCLTDREFFGGDLEHLRAIRQVVGLPVLRKDFLLAPVQVYEARAADADAILLIAEALEAPAMTDLAALAAELDMDVLAEAHSEAALEKALGCGARLVGVNNRDLATFQVRLETTERLASCVREGDSCGKDASRRRVLVSESGIQTAADVRRLVAAGVDAILVGESLLRSGDVAAKLAEFKSAT